MLYAKGPSSQQVTPQLPSKDTSQDAGQVMWTFVFDILHFILDFGSLIIQEYAMYILSSKQNESL